MPTIATIAWTAMPACESIIRTRSRSAGMTIRDFRYLIAVADCLNFHEAARRCHVTQSTLSIQLRKLEGYLGAECFERNRGGVRVTPAGRELVRHARDLLESFERMRRIGATFKRMHEQEQAAVPVSGFSCA
ncbi:hypothetical protein B1806_01470 [Metallibacterium scheffleri]|uniref:HTH lysR-type domain-containing protein n=2 Tax=Metallibacterium scheffleri TaxID=993689 RepID=A0A4S3KS55_9GAMM|nr:hypothetical protein B1806_01470 [Metallibacterium scheffleri]